ncbi:hypothetical protein [Chryseobacterium sp. RLHN22]|uniref:hypothetical protein n=1 Tax=Chryseobacterium sp. RLHN22 TaxID=3437885 RepID=UPI003D9BC9E3
MQIFPSGIYQFTLNNSKEETLERLKRRTEISERLIAKNTDKTFVGQINQNRFQLLPSSFTAGSFCELTGIINNSNGEVLIEINRRFRFLLNIFYFLPILGLIVELISNPKGFSFVLLLVLPFHILVIRFLFIGIFFKRASKQTLARLSDVLDTASMNKK